MAGDGPIVLLMAMRDEARGIIGRLGLVQVEARPWASWLPMRLYEGVIDGERVALVLLGVDPATGVDCIGPEGATLGARAAVDELGAGLIVNAGAAGGFEARGQAVGDVILSGGPFWYHDRRIPLGDFEAYGRGGYTTADVSRLADHLGLPTGVVSTGASLDAPASDLMEMGRTGAAAKDMEGAAIAWVAKLAGVELVSLKAITDLVDHPAPTGEQFMANLHVAMERLTDELERCVRALVGDRSLVRPPR